MSPSLKAIASRAPTLNRNTSEAEATAWARAGGAGAVAAATPNRRMARTAADRGDLMRALRGGGLAGAGPAIRPARPPARAAPAPGRGVHRADAPRGPPPP